MKKEQVLILSFLLFTFLFVTCTGRSRSSSDQDAFTLWVPFTNVNAALMSSWDDNSVYQHKEQVTGVKINFRSPPAGEEWTGFSLMIASNDLPDLISMTYVGGFPYPGGGAKAVEDGVILRLNELIEQYAPNFTRILDTYPEIKRQVMTDDGLIWGMGMLEIENQPPFQGPTIRQDWLDDLGLAMPQTIADWYNVLTQFKQAKGASTPFIMEQQGLTPCFLGAYDLDILGWVQRDTNVVYCYTDQGYLEYLTEMNKWYREGLFHPDFTVPAQNNWLATGAAGAYYQGFWMFTVDQNMIREMDPHAYIVSAPFPTKDANSITKVRNVSPNNRGNETVITTRCKDPELAIRWMDWNYSDEGYLWCNYGEEGVSHTIVDGQPQFTHFMTNNPDGYELHNMQYKYTFQEGPYVRDWSLGYLAYSDEAKATLETWNGDSSHHLPVSLLSFTAEESSAIANIMSDVNVYVLEMALRFIRGTEPLDNWDSYVQRVRDMGIDTVVNNYQAAYDLYLQRK